MSVVPSEIYFYFATYAPEADGVTVGGAPDFSKKPCFYDLAAAGTVDYVSSSASDTATKITVAGRDSTGAIQTETKTLTGTTPVAGSQSFQRLLYGASSGAASNGPLANPGGTTAVGDVAVVAHTKIVSAHTAQAGSANKSGVTPALFKLQSGDGATIGGETFGGLGLIIRVTGGTGSGQLREIVVPYTSGAYGADVVAVNRDWTTVPDNTSTYEIAPGFLFDLAPNQITAVIRPFSTIAADIPGGSARQFYEKLFVVNNDTATAFQAANLQAAAFSPSLPSGASLSLGFAPTVDDSATIANRQTAPASVSFTGQPSAVNVPSPGNLAPGAAPNTANAWGFWLETALAAGTAPYDGAIELQVNGTTT